MVSVKDINARLNVIQTYITVEQARNYIANQGYVAHTNTCKVVRRVVSCVRAVVAGHVLAAVLAAQVTYKDSR